MCYILHMEKKITDRKQIRQIAVISLHLALMVILLAVLIIYETCGGRIFRLRGGSSLKDYNCGETTGIEPDSYTYNLILVNRDHPLPDSFEPDIVFYRDTDVLMGRLITDSYGRLSDYIRSTGERLYVSSTYRSFEDQQRVFDEEGPEIAALPGTSEHQTGLAVDVYTMYHAGMAFLDCPAGRYVNDHCGEYGFIIRYPYGREDITGFAYEPWHLRYVGQPHAAIISENDLTLEEYLDLLQPGCWYSYKEYVLGKCPGDDIRIPSSLSDCEMTFSPDLAGNVIVTITLQ